jgi:hypothetical protein
MQVQGWAIRPPVLIAGALLLHVRGRARSRARRVARLHALRRLQLKERRALTHSKGLDELPSWLSRPNFEDPAWLNTLLAKLWPFVAKTLQVRTLRFTDGASPKFFRHASKCCAVERIADRNMRLRNVARGVAYGVVCRVC